MIRADHELFLIVSSIFSLKAAGPLVMAEVKFDPGAAKFGNFINYYQFNPPENRISLMPHNFLNITELDQLDTVLCLDIGCNSGVLTNALYDFLMQTSKKVLSERNSNKHQNFQVIAIDIDSILIERAKESNRNKNVTFLCLDIMKKESLEILNSYLKRYDKKSFDVSFSFSVTMWIHLNYGDDGLKYFLQTLCNLSTVLVLEPQPWKCYRNAIRRMRRTNGEHFKRFETLKIRNLVETEIYNFLISCKAEKVFETNETKWGRIIAIYKTTFKLL